MAEGAAVSVSGSTEVSVSASALCSGRTRKAQSRMVLARCKGSAAAQRPVDASRRGCQSLFLAGSCGSRISNMATSKSGPQIPAGPHYKGPGGRLHDPWHCLFKECSQWILLCLGHSIIV